jgi:hypothetical protein
LDALILLATDTGSKKIGTFASLATGYNSPNSDASTAIVKLLARSKYLFDFFKVELRVNKSRNNKPLYKLVSDSALRSKTYNCKQLPLQEVAD